MNTHLYWLRNRVTDGRRLKGEMCVCSHGNRAKVDSLVAESSASRDDSSKQGVFGSAFAKFKKMDDCGTKDAVSSTKFHGHLNTVT
jgi:hypothetical protein